MIEIKNMFTLVRIGVAASVSIVAFYNTFQRLRNKSDAESGRSLGNQHQNAEVESTEEAQTQSYNKQRSVKKNFNSKPLSGNLFLNRLPVVQRIDNYKFVVQKLKTIKEEEEQTILRNEHSNGPSRERSVQPVNRLPVVKRVDNSLCSEHNLIFQKLKTNKEEEEQARFILRNGHSNGPSRERSVQTVNRLTVVKRVDNSSCSGHNLIFQKLKTIKEEEEQARFILRNGHSNGPSREHSVQPVNGLPVVKRVDNSLCSGHNLIFQNLKTIKEEEEQARFILRNEHSNGPSRERSVQPVNRLPVVKRVDTSKCSGHNLIFQKLKTIKEEEEQARFILRNGHSNGPSRERSVQPVNRLPVVKRVDNSLCSGHNLIFQKLKTIKEEEEQARFILRNGHSNGPSSEPKINNITLAEVHKRPSWVAKPPPKPSPVSNGIIPVKALPPSGKPTPPHPPPLQGALRVPPPPPPPPPSRGMLNINGKTKGKLQRAPELVEFYHFLMKRKVKEATTLTPATAQSNIIAEIKNRSSFFLMVKADIETQGDFIRSLAAEVRAAEYTNVEDIVAFVNWLDEELAKLVDERAVLKHFDWPENKADALREAAFEYLDLKKLETEITSFVDDRKLSSDAALKKMYSLFEKVEKIVYDLLRRRDMAIARYKEFDIPCDWLLDSGFVSKIKLASVKLARDYMKRVASELDNTMNVREKEPMIEFKLLQCVRFALRVYQADECAVLKHFDLLEGKAGSLKEAVFEYQDLKKIETRVTSFVDDQKLSCDAALKMMFFLLEKTQMKLRMRSMGQLTSWSNQEEA